MNMFDHLAARFARPAAAKPPRRSLQLEVLEERLVLTSASVLPLDQAINSKTTFHLLTDALQVATTRGDVVTIEPGVTPDMGPVTVTTNGVTITGDTTVPDTSLPSYDIVISASNVTLTHLSLGTVTINPDCSGDAVTQSNVSNITVSGGTTGLGNVVIDQNVISGFVSIVGNVGTPLLNAQVTNNTISSITPAGSSSIINLQDVSNAVVQNNTITGDEAATQVGIEVTRGTNNTLANNTINLDGTDLSTEGILLQNPGANPTMSVTVNNNTIASGEGVGLYINALNDLDMVAMVQGNDFHGNAIGIQYVGSNSTAISTDLGGGANSLGTSLGGNDFRGFMTAATATNAAIVMQNVAAKAVLPAEGNLFYNPAKPGAYVYTPGSGAIDVTNTLNANQAFVQALYNSLLGRSGTVGELNSWVYYLKYGGKFGQQEVTTGILQSDESLDRIVDGYYLKYYNQEADEATQDYWVEQIHDGLTLNGVQAAMLSSKQFINANSGGYIQALFMTVLGRTASAADLTYWNAQLYYFGAAVVAKKFLALQEYRDDEVTALFQEFLHRNPSAGDLSYWTKLFGDVSTVEIKLLSTAEFFIDG